MPIRTPDVAAVRARGAGQAEVGDLDPAVVGEDDVLGLDVAVHDAGRVCRRERVEHRLEDVERLARGQDAALAEHLAQRAALQVLHREEEQAVVLALVEDGDDAGVGEPGRRAGLADEAVR